MSGESIEIDDYRYRGTDLRTEFVEVIESYSHVVKSFPMPQIAGIEGSNYGRSPNEKKFSSGSEIVGQAPRT